MSTKLAGHMQFHRKDFLEDAQTINVLETNIEPNIILNSFNNKIVTFGSCFAQNLQRIISRFGMDVYFERNSCAHYTTSSFRQLLELAVGDRKIDDYLYSFNDQDSDVIAFPFFRLRLYGLDARKRVINEANRLLSELREKVKQADVLTLTIGTTVTFEIEGRGVVSALNGMPLDICNRNNYQSVKDIKDDLAAIDTLFNRLRGNSDYDIVYTISPQRYNWREEDTGRGFYQFNTLSKSTLIVALNEFLEEKASSRHVYFPSYEIVIEELRQFETIATYDHLHINSDTTPRYVVKRFLKSFSTEKMQKAFVEMDNLGCLAEFTKARLSAGAQFESEMILPHWLDLIEKAKCIDGDGAIGLVEKVELKMNQLRDSK